MSDFIIHGIPGSPYMRAVAAALEEKGVTAYEIRPITPGAHRGEAYRAMHPFSRIPVVQHGDFTLYETQAILRYIDALYPRPALQPADPRAAARMNQLMGINDWYFFPQVAGPVVFQRIVGPVVAGITADEAIVAAAMPNATTCIQVIADLLGDKPFMVDDALTLADLLLYPQLEYFALTPEGRALMGGSPLMSWMERMSRRPSMLATLPPEPFRIEV